MLLPLLCIILVLQAVEWQCVTPWYKNPTEAQEYLVLGWTGPWQSLAVWVSFLITIYILTYLCSKWLPEKLRFYSTPCLQVLSAALLVALMPMGQHFALELHGWINSQLGGNCHIELIFIIEWCLLLPYIASQIIVLTKPGFDSFSSYKKSFGSAIRFQLFLMTPYLILSPFIYWLPTDFMTPLYALPTVSLFIFMMVSLAPSVIKFVMKTKVMEEGATKQLIEDQAKSLNINYHSLRVWESGPGQINAAVVGSVPLFRYLVITRGMMETFNLNEIKQVFWHEFGHIHHKHMWVYFLFFNCISNMGIFVGRYIETRHHDPNMLLLSLGSLLVFGIGFSFVSRRLERQADLFALKNSNEGSFYCDVLRKLSQVTGIPYKFYSLTHGSIKQRVNFLEDVLKNPHTAVKFNKEINLIFALLIMIVSAEWAYWFSSYLWPLL